MTVTKPTTAPARRWFLTDSAQTWHVLSADHALCNRAIRPRAAMRGGVSQHFRDTFSLPIPGCFNCTRKLSGIGKRTVIRNGITMNHYYEVTERVINGTRYHFNAHHSVREPRHAGIQAWVYTGQLPFGESPRMVLSIGEPMPKRDRNGF
jgi:hypothetical protein